MQQKVVITGGPGTGKSSVIDHLITLEYFCMPEISRQITRKGQKEGINQLFLRDPLLFSQLLLEGRVDQFKRADTHENEVIFFDRGIPDVFGYLDYLGMEYPDVYFQKSEEHRYSTVFMMPPWQEIYNTDNERYESFTQSMVIYEHLIEAYRKLNYELIMVPFGSVVERVDFILSEIDR